MREQGIDEIWPASERVLALIDHRASAGTALRRAWRFSSALRSKLVAVSVVPPGGIAALPIDERTGLVRNLRLAEDLNATTRVVEGDQILATLVAVVREENPTLVVLGHTPEGPWRRFVRKGLVDQLLHRLDNVDIQLVEVKEG